MRTGEPPVLRYLLISYRQTRPVPAIPVPMPFLDFISMSQSPRKSRQIDVVAVGNTMVLYIVNREQTQELIHCILGVLIYLHKTLK